MFGSFVFNGNKIARETSAADALSGWLMVTKLPVSEQIKTKVGDIIIKTPQGKYFRVHENPVVLNWDDIEEEVMVRYVNVNLEVKQVEE